MLILLSPSKTQDFEAPPPTDSCTQPVLLDESQLLMKELCKLTKKGIGKLMGVSEKIAALNYERYKAFSAPFTLKNAKQAAFAFQGDVYDGLDAASLTPEALSFAQARLWILSGLYGVLRPLDLIQPYRLEIKIKLPNPRGKNLYAFWGDRITDRLNEELAALEPKVVVNLASEEYFKAINLKKLAAKVITPQFKEKKKAGYQTIGLLAKKARGQLARYILMRNITVVEALQFFSEDGYRLNVALSKPESPKTGKTGA
jgi:cytoplasmic iron level regulating protein YaaA (DUF328/UPF0246 family)